MKDDWVEVKGFMPFRDDEPKTDIPLEDRVERLEGAVMAANVMLFGALLKSLARPQRRELIEQFRAVQNSLEEEAKQAKIDGRIGYQTMMREFDRVIEKLEKSAQ